MNPSTPTQSILFITRMQETRMSTTDATISLAVIRRKEEQTTALTMKATTPFSIRIPSMTTPMIMLTQDVFSDSILQE